MYTRWDMFKWTLRHDRGTLLGLGAMVLFFGTLILALSVGGAFLLTEIRR